MDPFAAAAQTLQDAAARPLGYTPSFEAFAQATPGPCIAIDGSHAVLVDNGALWLVAHRAAAVAWPGPRPIPSTPTVTAVVPSDAHAKLEAYCEGLRIRTARPATAEAFAQALREADEQRAALIALQAAAPGSLVLLDGAMHGLPEPAASMARQLQELARERAVDLVAVAKRSGLDVMGTPLLPALFAAGPSDRPWWTPIPDRPGVHAARLHRRALAAYRVDGEPAAMARLVPLARDAAYLGYPYPLALAHNTVALTQAAVAELKGRLADEIASRAGTKAARMLIDAHELLDRNVPS